MIILIAIIVLGLLFDYINGFHGICCTDLLKGKNYQIRIVKYD